MLLWIFFALMTAAVVGLLLSPLRRVEPEAVEAADADLAVYRDQLRELEAERDRGLISSNEIESARAEVARRLIKRAGAEASSAPAPAGDGGASVRKVYLAVAAALPLAAVLLYVVTGSPHLPARPFGERQAAPMSDSSIAELVGQVEQRLREHPEDGRGWDVIAPIYLRLGRFNDSAHAYAEANRLEGETVRRLLGFGESTLLAENGVVTEPVRRAALRVLQLQPDRAEAEIWLALAKEQDGDLAGAVADYKALIAKAPADARWRDALAERAQLVEQRMSGAPQQPAAATPGSAAPAPVAEAPATQATRNEPATAETAPAKQDAAPAMPDVDAMSPADREAFVMSMVNRLAARLETDGKDLDGWLRLARAYKVLGRDADAKAAIARAEENFAGDSAAESRIGKEAESLGIATKDETTPQ